MAITLQRSDTPQYGGRVTLDNHREFTTSFHTSRTANQAVVDLTNSTVMQADRHRNVYIPLWEQVWGSYTMGWGGGSYRYNLAGNPYGTFGLHTHTANELRTAESHQIANALSATILATSFSTPNFIEAVPHGDEDYAVSKKVSRLIMNGLEQPGNFRSIYEIIKDVVVFGTGLYRAMWDDDEAVLPRRVPAMDPETGEPLIDPDTGMPITLFEDKVVKLRDDIAIKPMSLTDVWIDPTVNRIHDAACVVFKEVRRRDSLEEMIGQDPKVDETAMMEALRRGTGGAGTDMSPVSSRDHKNFINGIAMKELRDLREHGYYMPFYYEGRVPKDIARKLDIDYRSPQQLISINGICVKKGPLGLGNGKPSIGALTLLPTGESVYGLSPLGVIRYMQDANDTMFRLYVQAAIEGVHQNYMVGGGAGVPPGWKMLFENRRPRQVFNVPGDPKAVQPVIRDYNGMQVAQQGLGMLSFGMREAAQARAPLTSPGQSRGTATEANINASSALQGTDQLNMLFERDELRELGDKMFWLNYLRLTDAGKIIRRVGDDMAENINFFDLATPHDIHFVGSRNALESERTNQSLLTFMQVAAGIPVLAAKLNWDAVVRRWATEGMKIKGVVDFFHKDEAAMMKQMQLMMLLGPSGNNAGSPTSSGGGASGNGVGSQGAGPSGSATGASFNGSAKSSRDSGGKNA